MTRGLLALVASARPTIAPVLRAVPTDHVEPHRLCLAVLLHLDASDAPALLARVDAAIDRAHATLWPYSARAESNARRAADHIARRLHGLSARDRVPVALSLALHLHDHSPITPPWRDIARVVDEVQAHGSHVITRAHEATAAEIAREAVRLTCGESL